MRRKKMNKRTSVVLCLILATILLSTTILAACSAGYATSHASEDAMWHSVDDSMAFGLVAPAATPMPAAAPPPPMTAPEAEMMWLEEPAAEYTGEWNDSYFPANEEDDMRRLGGGTRVTSITAPVTDEFDDKIIYSVFAELETMRFDDTIAGVHALMASHGAFIENSSISGVNYASKHYGWIDYRSAFFSIRVPVARLDSMAASLDSLGNVTHISHNATNITSQFFDTQSRLNSLTIQEERLLDMLSKADDVPDLILIEERLSDVRYQVESLTTTLNTWQNQVDFSTLTLNIREVEQFTERVEIHRSYWQQIGDGFVSTIRGVGRFFMNLFMWIIVSAPVLIIIAIVVVAALIVVRWKLRSYLKKRKESKHLSHTVPQQDE